MDRKRSYNRGSQGLKAEKASRSDLETYVAALNTEKAVMQAEMDKIKLDLQEVRQLLAKEKKEHAQLKQSSEAQRLQIMSMRSVLTAEQIAEMTKKDEQKRDRPIKIAKRREYGDGKAVGAKVVQSSPMVSHRLLSSKLSDLSINTSARKKIEEKPPSTTVLEQGSKSRQTETSDSESKRGDKLKVTVIVNQSLGLEPGKLAVETAHAISKLILSANNTRSFAGLVKNWADSGYRTVALEVWGEKHIEKLISRAKDNGFCIGVAENYFSSRYPMNATFVVAMGPGPEKQLDEITKYLKVLK